MSRRSRRAPVIGGGCILLLVLLCLGVGAIALSVRDLGLLMRGDDARPIVVQPQGGTPVPALTPVPTLTAVPTSPGGAAQPGISGVTGSLAGLYRDVNPGVVNIQVVVQQGGIVGQGAGSGFIIDTQGHIVTNNHVVEGARQVVVAFSTGLQSEARVVGTDTNSDLAVIQVDRLPDGVHPLQLGDSDKVEVGDEVVAIGNPFGLGSSISAGIVSALGRSIPTGITQFAIPQIIQTDAAINPGNSGGPLINMSGQVIGVNAQIATDTGQSSGVGFAISSNIVRRVAPALIANGAYQWPWLGIQGSSLSLALARANNLSVQQGAYVHTVIAGSPAEKAGLLGTTTPANQRDPFSMPRGGDVIVAIDGKPLTDLNVLLAEIALRKVGDKMQLTIIRGGQQQNVTVTLEARPTASNG